MRLNQKQFTRLSIFLLGVMLSHSALAGWSDKTRVSGFFTGAYSVTDQKEYFNGTNAEGGVNDLGSFQNTKLGVNINSNISDRISFASQLFGQYSESYAIHVDWAFANVVLTDTLSVRIGKIKYPAGLVNEYVDVGIAYPWQRAPLAIYSTANDGPLATRESYDGVSFLWSKAIDDMTYTVDAFGGAVQMDGMTVKGLAGLSGEVNWDDIVLFKATQYQGRMSIKDSSTSTYKAMNTREHKALLYGVKVDYKNFIFYYEAAKVEMQMLMMGTINNNRDSDSNYYTLGYNIGKWMPHYTQETWKRADDVGQDITTYGLNYSLDNSTVIKFGYSLLDVTGTPGLFDLDSNLAQTKAPEKTKKYSISISTVF